MGVLTATYFKEYPARNYQKDMETVLTMTKVNQIKSASCLKLPALAVMERGVRKKQHNRKGETRTAKCTGIRRK